MPPAVLEPGAEECATVEQLSPAASAPASAPAPPEADAATEKAAIKIQARTRGTLTRKATRGRLESEKELAKQALDEAAALEEEEAKALAPPAAGELPTDETAKDVPAQRDVGALRALAQETLLEAGANGTLAAALQSFSPAEASAPEQEKPAVGEKPQESEPQEEKVVKAAAPINVEDLRTKANKALMKGSFTDALVQVLQARGQGA